MSGTIDIQALDKALEPLLEEGRDHLCQRIRVLFKQSIPVAEVREMLKEAVVLDSVSIRTMEKVKMIIDAILKEHGYAPIPAEQR